MTIIVQTRDEPTCSVENCALPESCHFFENDRWVPHRFKSQSARESTGVRAGEVDTDKHGIGVPDSIRADDWPSADVPRTWT